MKTISAGPLGSFGVGSVRVVSSQDGNQLIDGGYAEIVEDEPEKKEAEVQKAEEVSKKSSKKDKVKKDGK